MDKNKQVLLRAEKILTKYKDYDNVYYKELQKSYKEYRSIDLLDKHTIDLYTEHINGLCDMIDEAKNALPMTIFIFIFFIIMVCITTFSTYTYFIKGAALKNNIIKANAQTSIKIEYGNLDNFNAMTLIANSEYESLNPLTAKISINTDSKTACLVHYDIYLEPQNDDISENELMSKDAFIYNLRTQTKNSDIQYLKDKKEKDGKILIFSNEVISNSVEDIELRMWLDSNTDKNNFNKKYRFKLYVDGYVV